MFSQVHTPVIISYKGTEVSRPLDYRLASVDLIIADIGERIARIRLSRNISQEALAEKTGLTRRTLSRLETGQGATLDTLIRVLRGLGLESHLEALLPNPGIQPARRLAGKGHERQRARTTAADKDEPWAWDGDETP